MTSRLMADSLLLLSASTAWWPRCCCLDLDLLDLPESSANILLAYGAAFDQSAMPVAEWATAAAAAAWFVPILVPVDNLVLECCVIYSRGFTVKSFQTQGTFPSAGDKNDVNLLYT